MGRASGWGGQESGRAEGSMGKGGVGEVMGVECDWSEGSRLGF